MVTHYSKNRSRATTTQKPNKAEITYKELIFGNKIGEGGNHICFEISLKILFSFWRSLFR
jgi:hypothetical protein